MSESYDVVLLLEQALTEADARQVLGLHEDMDQPVSYHLLLPVEDAAGRVEGAVATLGTPEASGPTLDYAEVSEIQDELLSQARAALKASVAAFGAADAQGELLTTDPVAGLVQQVERLGGDEVIVMTRPHVVAEFFHVDWTSRARRKLNVPILHLLEHETLDEQGENFGNEGITGI